VSRPWVSGAATTVGSLPGTDPAEAARLVIGELPDLPHLPELPGRGAGSDMIGRTAAMLVDFPVELVPTGWRAAGHPGRDLSRATDFLAWDLDAIEAVTAKYHGPLKLQAVGPWTLAAALELHTGHRIVTDPGATRDLAASLAEGLVNHLAEVAKRVPGAQLVLQLDEPALSAVLAGTLPTASGWGTVRAVDVSIVRDTLRDVLAVGPEDARAVHCCARDVPIALLREAGADALSLDLSLNLRQKDALGEAIDAGTSLWLGVLPSTDTPIGKESGREPIAKLWSDLGFPRDRLAGAVVPTPTCGMAGASPAYARRVLKVLHELTAWLRHEEGY